MSHKTLGLITVLVLIVVSIITLESGKVRPTTVVTNTDIILEAPTTTAPETSLPAESSEETPSTQQPAASTPTFLTPAQKAETFERGKEISSPNNFINVDNITVQGELEKGNVVLIDFWTYSCINCQRTLPYLNAWHDAYGDKGLTIIGIHTPEFDFEKELKNVQAAVTKFGVHHPVVLDNDFSTWRSYNNRYWPRKYLIDIDGFIVYDHIGEGGYVDTEQKIREVLLERAVRRHVDADLPSQLVSTSVFADTTSGNQTPETYFGAARNVSLGNIIQGKIGTQTVEVPQTLSSDTTYLGGTWNIRDEYAENTGNATIVLRYRAKIVNFVASSEEPVVVSISQDGKKVRDVTINDATLYELIRNDTPGEHTIEISVPESGLRAFTFTFG